MILLSTFQNEMEAQLVASALREAGIDYKLTEDRAEGYRVLVYEDDIDEAREILESRDPDDTLSLDADDDVDIDFDELEG